MSNNENPLVSVVIPTYKRPDMLGRAIDSVLNQTYDNIEIIIVDDNDEDSKYRKETEEFMEQYLDLNNFIYLKHKKNKGACVARNLGIKNANGMYIAFLDDDDEWEIQKIELQVNKALEIEAKLVSCEYSKIDQDGNLCYKIKKNSKYRLNDLLYGNCVGSNSLILVEKKTATKLLFDENLTAAQDFDFYIRFLKNNKYIYIVNKLLVKINSHTKERITTSGKNKYIGNKKFILKHYKLMNNKQKSYNLFKYRLLEWRINSKRSFNYFIKGICLYPWWKSISETKRVIASLKNGILKRIYKN